MSVGAKGEIFYGMHFYPGVAQYDDPNGSFRVFINEETIRKMNPTFAGRPIYVDHVEGVDDDLDAVKPGADGWVIESFFNKSDGKTWVKFVMVSERGLRAIKRGYRLSNAYLPKSFSNGGTWNGVDYQKQVMDGEYEHLAIVQDPRYEESVIMTPDEFKAYNESKEEELKRLANSKKGESEMKFFKRTKVENSLDIENTIVELPKSKKEVSLTKLINDYDTILNMNGYANEDHMVKINDKEEMSVKDLVKAHQAKCNELEEMKKKNSDMEGGEPGEGEDMDDPSMDNSEESVDENLEIVGKRGGDKHIDDSDHVENAEDDVDSDGPEEKKKDKMKNAKAKALALKNAHKRAMFDDEEVAKVSFSRDQVARGKARYGSN